MFARKRTGQVLLIGALLGVAGVTACTSGTTADCSDSQCGVVFTNDSSGDDGQGSDAPGDSPSSSSSSGGSSSSSSSSSSSGGVAESGTGHDASEAGGEGGADSGGETGPRDASDGG